MPRTQRAKLLTQSRPMSNGTSAIIARWATLQSRGCESSRSPAHDRIMATKAQVFAFKFARNE